MDPMEMNVLESGKQDIQKRLTKCHSLLLMFCRSSLTRQSLERQKQKVATVIQVNAEITFGQNNIFGILVMSIPLQNSVD
jgi:hypothetical protein